MKQSILILNIQVGKLNIRNLCFVILVIVMYPSVYSQSTIIDSLENAISTTTISSDSSVIMNELSKRLSDNNPSKAMFYAKNALDISKRIQNKKQEISAMYNIGALLYDSLETRSNSLSYFKDGEEQARKNGFNKLQANHLMRLANYYRYHEVDSTKAVTYLFQSLNVSKDINYDYGTARSFAKLASFYTRHRELGLCREYLDSAAFYYLKTPNGLNHIVHYYVEVGNKIWNYDPKTSMNIYWEAQKYSDSNPDPKISLANAHILLNEPEKAIEYLKDALPNLNNSQYPRKKGIALAKLAEAYFLIRDYEAASQTCQTGMDHLESVSVTSQSGLPSLYRTKANLFDLKNKSAEAINNYNISIEKGYNINELSEVHKSNLALGNFYDNKDLDMAIKYCGKALKGA